MSEVYMMITITSREKLPAFLAFYEKELPVGFVSLGYGTVKDEILDLLGLDRSEKAVCLHTVTGEVWKETKWQCSTPTRWFSTCSIRNARQFGISTTEPKAHLTEL